MDYPDPYPEIPSELKSRPQWVVWRYERAVRHTSIRYTSVGYTQGVPASRTGQSRAGESWAKVPYYPLSGERASTTDPSTWATYAQCLSHERIGYVFSSDDPYTGIDLDDCLDPDTGEIGRTARIVLGYLQTYAEASPSGRGIKLVVRGRLPEGRRRNQTLGVEMYDRTRFFAMTGERLSGAYAEIREVDLAPLHRLCFGPPPPTGGVSGANAGSSAGPRRRSRCSDATVLGKARAAANAPKFERLWDGDTTGYATPSEADLALCRMLAYWTDGDAATVEELFSRSGLVRPKWSSRADYRARTIRRAVASLISQPP